MRAEPPPCEGCVIMVSGAPGTGKSRIANRLLELLVSRGEETVYITTELSPVEIERSISAEAGLSRVSYFDATSWSIEDYRRASSVLGRVTTLHTRRVEELLEEVQGVVENIIVNSLSSFLFRAKDRRQIKRLRERFSYTRTSGGILLFTVHEYVHPPRVYSLLESGADIIIKTHPEEAPVEKAAESPEGLVVESRDTDADAGRIVEELLRLDINVLAGMLYRVYAGILLCFQPPKWPLPPM